MKNSNDYTLLHVQLFVMLAFCLLAYAAMKKFKEGPAPRSECVRETQTVRTLQVGDIVIYLRRCAEEKVSK